MNTICELVQYHINSHAIELLIDKKYKLIEDFDSGLINCIEYNYLLKEIESDIYILSGPLPSE